MPVVDTNVIDGPNVQADGQHRGTVEFVFGDGRTFTRNVRAPDANAWANLVADLPTEVAAKVAESDAESDINDSDDIEVKGEATKPQRAVAYLRAAYADDDPYRAFRLMSKFNSWRQSEGYSMPQVKAAMLANGMDADEYDRIVSSYQWLSNTARVLAMQTYEDVRTYWEGREQ